MSKLRHWHIACSTRGNFGFLLGTTYGDVCAEAAKYLVRLNGRGSRSRLKSEPTQVQTGFGCSQRSVRAARSVWLIPALNPNEANLAMLGWVMPLARRPLHGAKNPRRKRPLQRSRIRIYSIGARRHDTVSSAKCVVFGFAVSKRSIGVAVKAIQNREKWQHQPICAR